MTIADTINTWFAEQIATGPIARSTDAYNQALAAKEALIAALDTPAPAPAPAAPTAAEKAAAKIAADQAVLAADQAAANQTAAPA